MSKLFKEEPRGSFYDNEINIDRVNEVLNIVISQLNLKEILKMTREVMYDMVSYYDEQNCAMIYKSNDYGDIHIEQITNLQRHSRQALDLFSQVICGKREFDNDYIENIYRAESRLNAANNKIKKLENIIKDLECEMEELQDVKNKII